jgi:hypothetical protein
MSFATSHPAEFNWITTEAAKGNSFAQNCLWGIRRYGQPTANMIAAVQRNLQPSAKTTTEPTAVDSTRLRERFDHAFKVGRLKFPKLHFGQFVISRAPDTGRNPGALYVKSKDNGGTYLGMVKNTGFTASRDCDPETAKTVLALIADPFSTIDGYGRRTGNCACCGRTLTAQESVDSGIGPICRAKWGF